MKVSYLLQETKRNIDRRRGPFFLGSAVEAICILLLSIFLAITINLVAIARLASQRAELYAFLSDEAAADPNPLIEQIASLDGVSSVRFVTKEEALNELHSDLGSDAFLLDALEENPLPASIRAALQPTAATPDEVAAIEHKLLLLPGITEVWSGKEIIVQLSRAVRTVMALDVIILVIVALSIVFIVFQTVETSIASRRTEIEIMELVGATKTTVYIPFLLEGTVQGIIGGSTGFLLLFIISRLVATLTPVPFFSILPMAVIDTLLGGLLGLIGSTIALNRSSSSPRE
ncbi:MAG: permease-like cell division protein FtsX [candidate division WOR-3 bacterium]